MLVEDNIVPHSVDKVKRGRPPKKRSKKRYVVLFSILAVVLVGVVTFNVLLMNSRVASTINMSSTACNMSNMKMDGMSMSGGSMCNAALPHSGDIPITSLQAPQTAAHIDTFTLTARTAHLTLGPGVTVDDAWTFNGTLPGPTLHVKQGDLVVVHLVNTLSIGVTIHWHGIDVPNASDGVAGVTQNAVKPGQTYTYRFVAKDSGTYWYHSHQESYDETTAGLYGMIIVDPIKSTTHDDVEATLDMHKRVSGSFPFFSAVSLINGSTQTQHIAAQPGQWVHLHILNSSNDQHVMSLVGTPFMVSALDGHDLNKPTALTNTILPIGAAQRYDLRFQMPQRGPVTLFESENTGPFKNPAMIIGQGNAPGTPPSAQTKWFDLTSYGSPRPDPLSPSSHVDVTYDIHLGNHTGFFDGRFGPVHTINGQSFPNIPTLMVKTGQVVKLRFVNDSTEIHPMHLHGHSFSVLSHNGHPITGSPVYLDTINIQPHDTYEVAFLANNPGLWMLHCHNLFHAYWGMDMMIVYANIYTPFTIGSTSGNSPD